MPEQLQGKLVVRQYQNPILPGFNPDPSICRNGQDYYLSTSSFWYYPMLPIYHSRDLINWTLINHGINREEQAFRIEEGCRNGMFAPTIRYHEQLKRYFMVACYNNHPDPARRSLLISTDSPEKPWSSPVFIAPGCCDPSFFFDRDNRAYLQYVTDDQDKIYQYEINLKTGKALSTPIAIWQGTGGRFLEAPHVYYINNRYYLIAAEGGTEFGHYISIARADDVNGPYEGCPGNPILTHRDRNAQFSPIQCTGHGDLVQGADGLWWIVCLGTRPVGGMVRAIPMGRETFLAPLEWNDDAWPVVKNPGYSDGTLNLITMPEREMAPKRHHDSWCDDFDSAELDINWYFLRTPLSKFWSLSDKPGWLKLNGSATVMGQWKCPSLICRRQKHFNFTTTVKMLFTPSDEIDEAGLLIFSNDARCYEIGVKKQNGRNIIFLRKTVLDICCEKEVAETRSSEIFLKIEGNRDNYRLHYGFGRDMFYEAGTGTALLITHPWTGNHLGLYAVSGRQTPAYFDGVEYTGNDL